MSTHDCNFGISCLMLLNCLFLTANVLFPDFLHLLVSRNRNIRKTDLIIVLLYINIV